MLVRGERWGTYGQASRVAVGDLIPSLNLLLRVLCLLDRRRILLRPIPLVSSSSRGRNRHLF